MKDDLNLFIDDFVKARNQGFVPSRRKSNTGIGKTFEDIMGVIENNDSKPDLHGFELKSQRNLSASYVTLFTKAPTMPKSANTHLRESYGSLDAKHNDIRVLHTSIFNNRFNNHISGSSFSLSINYQEERIYILVKGNDGSLDSTVYYSFDNLRKALSKIENLAFVTADTEVIDGIENFHFKQATIFYDFISFENFLKLLEEGLIMYDIRIGAYKTGLKKGRTHDHGSGFRIKRENMKLLYSTSLTI